jgi:hypothetical protein
VQGGSASCAEIPLRSGACLHTLKRCRALRACRNWRRSCPTPDDKYRFLKLCGPDALKSLFKVEISAEVLRELLAVLQACWLGHAGVAEEAVPGGGAALREAGFVVQVLSSLTGECVRQRCDLCSVEFMEPANTEGRAWWRARYMCTPHHRPKPSILLPTPIPAAHMRLPLVCMLDGCRPGTGTTRVACAVKRQRRRRGLRSCRY